MTRLGKKSENEYGVKIRRLKPLSKELTEKVKKEVVDLLAQTIVNDVQRDQEVRENMTKSTSGNLRNKRESDEGILRDLLNQ